MHLTEIRSKIVDWVKLKWYDVQRRALANMSVAALIPRQEDVMLAVTLSDYCVFRREILPPTATSCEFCVKGKFVSLCLISETLRHEGVWGRGCIDAHFLDLYTSWRWVVRLTPRPLYPRGKTLRYPLDRRLSVPQSRSGRLGEEKILDPSGTRTPTRRSSSS
jgi:hypothetical protein